MPALAFAGLGHAHANDSMPLDLEGTKLKFLNKRRGMACVFVRQCVRDNIVRPLGYEL